MMTCAPAGAPERLSQRAALLGLSLLLVLPIWLTRHPPIQDWPQHLAAVRVLHSFSDPAFGFSEFFRLAPADTQYLTVYYLADLLAHGVGLVAALKLVLSLSIVALPITICSLGRALGRSGTSALLALPLTYTAHTILGFINFVAALPLMLLILTLAVEQRSQPRRSRPWIVAALLIVCFYTHVVPFALALLGSLLVSVDLSATSLRRLSPLIVVALLVLPWFAFSPAGEAVLASIGLRHAASVAPVFTPVREAWAQIPLWLTNVWKGEWDRWLLIGWAVVALAWLGAGIGFRRSFTPSPVQRSAVRRLLVLPPLCLLGYFFLPAAYAWIWPINTRFLLLGILLSAPLIGEVPRSARYGLAFAAGALAITNSIYVSRAFVAFDAEVADLQTAIEQIPPRAKVAGLIWSRGSRVVEFSPFLHSVAYYQAERGGAVMFTFADFPQSPFHFRADNRPPPVKARWEWTPERVLPDRDLGWYDWILTRGGPDTLPGNHDFSNVFSSRPWRVWKRMRPRPGG
jgi:hypothetical protein